MPSGAASLLVRLIRSREFSVIVVIALLCVLLMFTPASETFFTQRNLLNVTRQVALLAIFAIGEVVVIIAGGIDLSVGSLIAFTGMLMALMITRVFGHLGPTVAVSLGVGVALLASLAIGGLHATLIHYLRLPPFVVTLASLLVLRSQSSVINNQLQITLQDYPALLNLANGNLLESTGHPVPVPVVILLAVALAAAAVLGFARIGRYVYSVGSNEAATRLSGVNVYRVKLFAYGLSALLGGVAGVLWAAYGGQGDPQAGNSYELDAVASCVVGGASLNGGQGSVAGAVLGAVLLQVIFSAINLALPKPDLWRGSVVGGVLLFAVLIPPAVRWLRARAQGVAVSGD